MNGLEPIQANAVHTGYFTSWSHGLVSRQTTIHTHTLICGHFRPLGMKSPDRELGFKPKCFLQHPTPLRIVSQRLGSRTSWAFGLMLQKNKKIDNTVRRDIKIVKTLKLDKIILKVAQWQEVDFPSVKWDLIVRRSPSFKGKGRRCGRFFHL